MAVVCLSDAEGEGEKRDSVNENLTLADSGESYLCRGRTKEKRRQLQRRESVF